MATNKDTGLEIIVTQELTYTLSELCEICEVHVERINEIIDYGIIASKEKSPKQWRFSYSEMETLQKVLRLERDLDLNMPGIAMTLDLLEQVETLRKQVDLLEHQLLHFMQTTQKE
jgi:chaperone modulatory protein CbpM